MSFNVKFIYDLVDRLSPALKTINRNIEANNQSIKKFGYNLNNNLNNSSFNKFGNNTTVVLGNIGKNIDKISEKSKQLGKDYFFKSSIPLSLLGMKFIKTASDYQESLNKVDVAFGSSAESVKAFANIAGKNFGIDKSSALDMAAQFGDMATSMGLSQKNASGLANSLVGLAGDLTSFKNLKGDMAKTALNAIFTGETESLKMLGVVMTETNLKQFALTKGITKKIEQMRQDEKVMLRYNYIMAMTSNAQGDFKRTISGFANQTRVLNDNLNTLSITLGTAILPYANKFLGILITLAEKFNELSPTTQKIILFFGALAIALPPLLFFFGKLAPIIFAIGSYLFRFALLNFAPLILGFIIFKKYGTQILEIFEKIWDVFAKIGKGIGADKFINKIATKLGFDPVFAEPKAKPMQSTAPQSFSGGFDVNFANMPKNTTVSQRQSSPNFNLGFNTTYAN